MASSSAHGRTSPLLESTTPPPMASSSTHTRATPLLRVTIPRGIKEGQSFLVDIGGGRTTQEICPAAPCGPGSEIHISAGASSAGDTAAATTAFPGPAPRPSACAVAAAYMDVTVPVGICSGDTFTVDVGMGQHMIVTCKVKLRPYCCLCKYLLHHSKLGPHTPYVSA